MKSSIVRILVTLSLVAALSPLALMAQSRVNITIPFDFTVGTKFFRAGDYRVQEMTDKVLLIRNVKSGPGVMTIVMPDLNTEKSGLSRLTFHHYGDSYFLYSVASGSRGWRLLPSRAEKELIAKAGSPKPVSVAAAVTSK
jgi:hypothetical protein